MYSCLYNMHFHCHGIVNVLISRYILKDLANIARHIVHFHNEFVQGPQVGRCVCVLVGGWVGAGVHVCVFGCTWTRACM